MSILELNINSKMYQIGCAPEDVAKIKQYAVELNRRIEEFKAQDPKFFMGLNDERVFLFQALTLIADLQDLKSQDLNANSSVANKLHNNLSVANINNENMELIDNIASRVHNIEHKIKNLK